MLNKDIRPQKIIADTITNYYFFVALLPCNYDLVKIRKLLLKKRVDVGICDEITDDCEGIVGRKDCPNTTKVFGSVIHLPLYESLSNSQIQNIANILNSCIKT